MLFMAALATAANTVLAWLSTEVEDSTQAPVDAAANTGGGLIYAGYPVGENGSTGYYRQFQSADVFLGIALRNGDNSGNGSPLGFAGGNVGDGTAGSIKVAVKTRGKFAWRGTITGLAAGIAAANTKVYWTDATVLTTTAGGGNAQCGVVQGYDVDNACFVIELVGGVSRNA